MEVKEGDVLKIRHFATSSSFISTFFNSFFFFYYNPPDPLSHISAIP